MSVSKILLALFCFAHFSCSEANNAAEDKKAELLKNQQEQTAKIDSIQIIKAQQQAYKKHQAEKTKLRKEGNEDLIRVKLRKDSTFKFPACEYSKVILYELNGKGNHSRAESVFRQRTKKSKELNSEELKDFLKLLNNKDSYGNGTAACHEPRIGLVFYDRHKDPCAYLSLCLACNNVYTKPGLNLGLEVGIDQGFSLKSRKKLHKIFEKWGFPDKNFSPLFDDEELYGNFLKKQGFKESDIEETVKDYFKKEE
ncbi:MAG: hypothetical protein GY810_13430 [Aureispira sp.]|nr:hypothetical protein [Aureispira sp.]